MYIWKTSTLNILTQWSCINKRQKQTWDWKINNIRKLFSKNTDQATTLNASGSGCIFVITPSENAHSFFWGLCHTTLTPTEATIAQRPQGRDASLISHLPRTLSPSAQVWLVKMMDWILFNGLISSNHTITPIRIQLDLHVGYTGYIGFDHHWISIDLSFDMGHHFNSWYLHFRQSKFISLFSTLLIHGFVLYMVYYL
jgi:hypothetical protein